MWSAQLTTGKKPPPLCAHTFIKIDHHRAVVFGGSTGRVDNNDTYVLDLKTWVGRCISGIAYYQYSIPLSRQTE